MASLENGDTQIMGFGVEKYINENHSIRSDKSLNNSNFSIQSRFKSKNLDENRDYISFSQSIQTFSLASQSGMSFREDSDKISSAGGISKDLKGMLMDNVLDSENLKKPKKFHICGGDSDLTIDSFNDLVDSQMYNDGKTNPNIEIIHRTFPNKLLAKACVEIARRRPDNPMQYLAGYLAKQKANVMRHEAHTKWLKEIEEYKQSLLPDIKSTEENEEVYDELEGDVISFPSEAIMEEERPVVNM